MIATTSMQPYVIQRGEYLTLLAHRQGFDANAVWQDVANDALRGRRRHYDLLCAGDVLHVPSLAPAPSMSVQPGQSHSFRARVPTVHMRVVLRAGTTPQANVSYELTGLPRPVHGTTGDDGVIEFHVPIGISHVELHLPARHEVHVLGVGDLDPANEPSGLRARLCGLGYHVAQHDRPDDRDRSLRRAVEDFQTDHGLSATGELDDDTLHALASAFGC